MKHILSYGGGVNSSALFFHILEKKMPLDLIIFADTGEELPETYDAVERMKILCCESDIEFVTVQSKHGNLYDYYYKKKAVMSMMRRDCTGKFKVSPIRKYLRERFGKKEKFGMYIGIAWDEQSRRRDSDVQYIENSYPFCDDKIMRTGNYEILKKYNFEAQKSGCIGCMYLKKQEWIRMFQNNRPEFERHKKLEQNNSRYPDILLNGTYKLEDLEKHWKDQSTLESFIDVRAECDIYGGCFL